MTVEYDLSLAAFSCFVPGIPRPQGSKSRGKNGHMYEASKHVKLWRNTVQSEAVSAKLRAGGTAHEPLFDGPLMLGVEFLFRRPAKHFQAMCLRVHNDLVDRWLEVRPGAPVYVTGPPDKDKLVRAVGDALKLAGVVRDDSLFVRDHPSGCKRYANPGEEPGAWIYIWRLT